MRPTNTSVIRRVMSVSSPSQWNGAVAASPPACSDCVRRGPWQVKFQTRPSSFPSAWQDAQARKPPALAWNTRCPVSARLIVDSVRVSPPAKASIAGSRDCTTTLPAPSKATAIGCPTVGGTDGIRNAAGGRRSRATGAGRAGGLVPAGPASSCPCRSNRPCRFQPPDRRWRAGRRPRSPGLQGPCMPSGMQPT